MSNRHRPKPKPDAGIGQGPRSRFAAIRKAVRNWLQSVSKYPWRQGLKDLGTNARATVQWSAQAASVLIAAIFSSIAWLVQVIRPIGKWVLKGLSLVIAPLKWLTQHWVSAFVFAVLLFVSWEVFEVSKTRYYVEPLVVSKSFSDSTGITGIVASAYLRDEIEAISTSLAQTSDAVPGTPGDPHDPLKQLLRRIDASNDQILADLSARKDIQIPTIGVSLRSVAEWVLQAYEATCIPTWRHLSLYANGGFNDLGCASPDLEHERLTGEVTTTARAIQVQLRLAGRPVVEAEVANKEVAPELVMREAAQELHAHIFALREWQAAMTCDELQPGPTRCADLEPSGYQCPRLNDAWTTSVNWANLYAENGQTLAALTVLKEVEGWIREQDSGCLRWHLGLDLGQFFELQGAVLQSVDRPHEALAAFAKAIELGDETYWSKTQLAEAHLQLGNVEAAELRVRELLDSEPYADDFWRAQWHHSLGKILAANKRFTDANGSFSRAVALAPDDPWIAWAWADSLSYDQGRNDLAIPLYRDAATRLPDRDRHLLENDLSWALAGSGQYEEAARIAWRLLENGVVLSKPSAVLGFIAAVNLHSERALTHFKRSMDEDWKDIAMDHWPEIDSAEEPGSLHPPERSSVEDFAAITEYLPEDRRNTLSESLSGICWALIDLARFAEAEDKCRAATELNPRNGFAWADWGRTLSERGRYDEAISILKKGMRSASGRSTIDLHIALSEALRSSDRHAEGLSILNSALQRFPGNASLRLTKAESLIEMRRLVDATRVLSIVLGGQNPHPTRGERASAMTMAGRIALEMGYPDDARECSQAAKTLTSRHPWARVVLAEALAELGHACESHHEFAEVVGDFAHISSTRLSWGESLLKQKRPEPARTQFHAALLIDPFWSRAHAGLARVATQLESPDDALRHVEQGLALDPFDGEVHLAKAEALQEQGRMSEATAAYQQARALAPWAAEASLALARHADLLGDPDTALAAYRETLARDPHGIHGAAAYEILAKRLGTNATAGSPPFRESPVKLCRSNTATSDIKP